MTSYIYKICPTILWQEAVEAGQFKGAGIDIQDGYIHFSTAEQTPQTLALHFAGQDALSLVQVACEKLNIVWEPSRGGQLFPHLYESLPMSAVTQIWELQLDETGMHMLPDLAE